MHLKKKCNYFVGIFDVLASEFQAAKRATGRLNYCFARHSGLRPRTRIHLWNALVRPVLECGMGLLSPILPQCLKNQLQSVQTQFLRATLRARNQPLHFPLSECDQEDLQARWDKSLMSLLNRMHQQPDDSMTKDLPFLALDKADALRSSWGSNARSVLHCIVGPDQSARGFGMPENPDQTCPKRVDLDLNRRVRTRLSTDDNLRRSFCLSIKPDTPITESRAWSKSHIGRPASRSFERHLDDWHDNSGVLLKLQFRAGTCETEEHRAEIHNLPPSSSAPDSIKTKVLLGAPLTDDPNVDRRVDIAFRKFLLRWKSPVDSAQSCLFPMSACQRAGGCARGADARQAHRQCRFMECAKMNSDAVQLALHSCLSTDRNAEDNIEHSRTRCNAGTVAEHREPNTARLTDTNGHQCALQGFAARGVSVNIFVRDSEWNP
eukprot:jgi/Bigna1/72328/fgenesh1_pg.19_\